MRDIDDLIHIKDLVREDLRAAMDRAEEEWLDKFLYGDMSGKPMGVLNMSGQEIYKARKVGFSDFAAQHLLVHPNDYKELTGREEPHREVSPCLVSLLLDGLPTRQSWLLPVA